MVVFNFTQYQTESTWSDSAHGQSAPVRCMWIGCSEWFGSLEGLASHVSHSHTVAGKGGLFFCGWKGCSRGDQGFNARYKMIVHVRTHTNEKPHQCYICDKSFSRAENLKIHARSHTGERPYVCPVVGCGKAYSNSSDRFKHTRTHSVDKPYVCKVAGCPKRYTDPSSLRKHVKSYRHFPSPSPPTSYAAVKPEFEQEPKASSPMEDTTMTVLRSSPIRIPTECQQFSTQTSFTSEPTSYSFDEPTLPVHWAQPAATTYQPPFPAWPGYVHWYVPEPSPQQYNSVYYSEQETPLDLTNPIRLQNRV